MLEYFQDEGGLAGSFFWSAVGRTIPDHDGYSVHLTKFSRAERQSTRISQKLPNGAEMNSERNSFESISPQNGSEEHLRDLPDEADSCSAQNKPKEVGEENGLLPQQLGDNSPKGRIQKANALRFENATSSQQTLQEISWLDEDLVTVLRNHTSQISYLNGNGICSLMWISQIRDCFLRLYCTVFQLAALVMLDCLI